MAMTLRAFVIEDEPALRNFYDKVLTQAGYDVTLARDGRLGIELFDTHPLPQLLILDVRLPDMDGLDVLQHMANHPDLHSIHVVIATAGQEYEQYVGIVPSSEFLLKPVLPSQILAIAKRIAEGQKA